MNRSLIQHTATLLAFAVLLTLASCGSNTSEHASGHANGYANGYTCPLETYNETHNNESAYPPYDTNEATNNANDEANIPTETTSNDATTNDAPTEPEPECQIWLAEFAAPYFARLQAIWDKDNGQMWGTPLHIPVIIFCTDTDVIAASSPGRIAMQAHDIDGIAVYTATMRINMPGIGRMSWQRQQLGVFIQLQFMQTAMLPGVYDSSLVSLMHINHYAFHALQPSLMGVDGAYPPAGANNETGRISIMLEINALIYAIHASGEAKFAAAFDALSIRHGRRYAFPSAMTENLQQVSEGTAVYTDHHMVFTREEIDTIITSWPAHFMYMDDALSVAISYGYYGGALYGMLLDDFGVDWRPHVGRDTDLGLMLQEALGITYFIPLDEVDLERYGYTAITERVRQ